MTDASVIRVSGRDPMLPVADHDAIEVAALRLECLKLAVASLAGVVGDDRIGARAATFAEFVLGGSDD